MTGPTEGAATTSRLIRARASRSDSRFVEDVYSSDEEDSNRNAKKQKLDTRNEEEDSFGGSSDERDEEDEEEEEEENPPSTGQRQRDKRKKTTPICSCKEGYRQGKSISEEGGGEEINVTLCTFFCLLCFLSQCSLHF